MKRNIALLVLGIAGVIGPWSAPAMEAQSVFSYVDDQGVRVFTNIAPKQIMPGMRAIAIGNRKGDSEPSPALTIPTALRRIPEAGTPAGTPPPGGKKSNFDPIIRKYSALNRLDPELIRSVIAAESGFNPRALSRKGARGLMQLMPGTAARLGVRNAFDPEDNIRGGTQHLRTLLDSFGDDLVLSLAAYNAGENLVQRIGRVPDYPETHSYIRSITGRYGKREMAPIPPADQRKPVDYYRFTDSTGVLYLTNIPPSRLMENAQASLGGVDR